MNRVNRTKSEDKSGSASHSDQSANEGTSTPSVTDSKKEELEDDFHSQEDVKSEQGSNAMPARMELRERRKRNRPNHRYSPDVSPAPVPAVERRSSARAEKGGPSSMNTSTEMSHWLQCDLCHKWRIVAHKLFEELKKQSHFQCRNLQGVTCKDRDDWAAGSATSEDVSMKDDTTNDGYYRKATVSHRSSKHIRRVNIFAGRYIPGFGGEFSDLDE